MRIDIWRARLLLFEIVPSKFVGFLRGCGGVVARQKQFADSLYRQRESVDCHHMGMSDSLSFWA